MIRAKDMLLSPESSKNTPLVKRTSSYRSTCNRQRKIKNMKYLIALLAVAGIVVSSMALHVHYMDPSLAPPCAVTERFDCGAVNHSRFAVFPAKTFDEKPGTLHIPVAAVGIVGYALIAVLALMGRWWLVFEVAQIGFLCAAFLSYIEAYVLQKWCIYCLWSQGLVTAILLLTLGILIARWRQGHGGLKA
jgi:vitamin-K-epoxide reductase (warfarin-sensitive)